MNSDVMPSRVQMEPILLKQLVAEVKETIATDVTMSQSSKSSSFRAINFWNLQRRGRYVNSGTKRKKNTGLSVTHVAF
jgi:23S rRNA A1618 N6-methylase RlmF